MLYHSAPLESDIEQRLEKKLNDVNSFKVSIENNKETIAYFKYQNRKTKKKDKSHETLSSLKESVNTVANFGTAAATYANLLVTSVVFVEVPVSKGLVGALFVCKKAIYKIILKKCTIYK